MTETLRCPTMRSRAISNGTSMVSAVRCASTKFKGGQSNPTYRDRRGQRKLCAAPETAGQLLASAHAVDREFRVFAALHGSAVPVARALHLCADESMIGSMFYLMEFVDGPIHWDPSLPDISPTSVARTIARSSTR